MLVVVPEAFMPAGVLLIVHVPTAGKPFKTTLPVAIVQVGCVIATAVGAVGILFTVSVAAFDVALLHHYYIPIDM